MTQNPAAIACTRKTYEKMYFFWRAVLLYALLLPVSSAAMAQSIQCPQTDERGIIIETPPQTLEGRLIYHDGMRKWFELKLDKTACEEGSIQLVSPHHKEMLFPLRGCKVQTKGIIDLAPTTHYMLNVFQEVDQIKPIDPCPEQSTPDDYASAVPDKAIENYRIDMWVNYTPGDHPIIFKVTNKGEELHPWQAYASYRLTGDYVLYGYCGKGFVVDKVFGMPLAIPDHLDKPETKENAALFAPEFAAEAGITDIHVGYSCVRKP